jgi:hypothetical protein
MTQRYRMQQCYKATNIFLYALHLCYLVPSFDDQAPDSAELDNAIHTSKT